MHLVMEACSTPSTVHLNNRADAKEVEESKKEIIPNFYEGPG